MNKRQGGYTVVELLILIVYVAGAVGWIANLVKLIGIIDGGITGMMILRAIGVFLVPLGAILGIF